MRRGWLLVGLAPVACAACGAFFDLSKLGAEAELVDSGPDAADAADAAPEANPDEDSSAPCLDGGVPMKRIGAFCIDQTEVSQGDYETFLARTDGGASAPRSKECEDDRDRVPSEEWHPGEPFWRRFPVIGVSYCDAWSYCHAAGKRLCGRRGGGALASADVGNAETNEWYRACSSAGTKTYPYGNQSVNNACATDNTLREVGQGCEGGYPGIFDMVGNAGEWVDACDVMFNGTPLCVMQGGHPTETFAKCTTHQVLGRNAKYPFAGIRCCAD